MAKNEVQIQDVKQNVQKDLIDMVDFTKLMESTSRYDGKIREVNEYIRVLDKYSPHSKEYREFSPSRSVVSSNIEQVLFYVYLCKSFVSQPTDMRFVLEFLESYSSEMSEADARIVFDTFNKLGLTYVLNNMDTNANIFEAVTGVSGDELIVAVMHFDDKLLDVFLKTTGATKFVDFIKRLKIKRQQELEEEARLAPIREAARKKKEAEEAKERAEREAARKKKEAEEAKERAEREAKEAAEKAKMDAEEKENQEKRNKIVSARLLKLAENFDRGHYKYTMKVRWALFSFWDIKAEDIRKLPKDDAGLHAMFGALVRMQTKIKTPDELKIFDEMLGYMDVYPARMFLNHVSLAEMLAIVGLREGDLTKPGKSADDIARYRKVMNIINEYPAVFKRGFNVALSKFPHDKGYDINSYDNGIELALQKVADRIDDRRNYSFRESVAKKFRSASKKTRKVTNPVSNFVYKGSDKEH